MRVLRGRAQSTGSYREMEQESVGRRGGGSDGERFWRRLVEWDGQGQREFVCLTNPLELNR